VNGCPKAVTRSSIGRRTDIFPLRMRYCILAKLFSHVSCFWASIQMIGLSRSSPSLCVLLVFLVLTNGILPVPLRRGSPSGGCPPRKLVNQERMCQPAICVFPKGRQGVLTSRKFRSDKMSKRHQALYVRGRSAVLPKFSLSLY
jgi:hypothetical protein